MVVRGGIGPMILAAYHPTVACSRDIELLCRLAVVEVRGRIQQAIVLHDRRMGGARCSNFPNVMLGGDPRRQLRL